MTTNEQHPEHNPGWKPPSQSDQDGWTAARPPAGHGQTGSPTGPGQSGSPRYHQPGSPTGYGQSGSPTGHGQPGSPTRYGQPGVPTGYGQPGAPTGHGRPGAPTTPRYHGSDQRPGSPEQGPQRPAGAPYLAGTHPVNNDRKRPGWTALVGVAAGAALVASFGTAGLTGAFNPDSDTTTTSTAQSDTSTDGGNADPVVTSTTTDPDWANVAAAVTPSVVAIDVRTAGGVGAGSGVILDDAGHVLTNDHVVGDAVDGGIQVTLSDGRIFTATVAGVDPATDLAVITIDSPPSDLQPATLGNSDDVVVGDPVVAVGNPLGLSSTVTTGIVSALDRPVSTTEAPQAFGQQGNTVVTNAIQVDAAINPGNSGGPLFDAAGRVIGINSSIASMSGANGSGAGSIGLGFAIPSNLASQVAEQLIDNGVAEHAFLGVSLSDGTAQADGVTRAGAEVRQVEPGTPAADAGVQTGDVIVAIGEDQVNGAESLTGFVRQHAAGDEVTLTVVRGGTETELVATLASREDS